ncbi:MAG: VIT1/CCC1 transporter family protein [Candidatus Bathyarchaeota archaeon]|nr:VIT1/CCC1 transporter family protein [Candidatus Bathyarchaeota archaeon]
MELNLREYLHEKAQESRNNERQGYLMLVAGVTFFVGGVLTNLKIPGDVWWFLIIPYHADFNAGAILGLSLIMSGLCLMILGIIVGSNYHREREWLMEELKKTYMNELRKAKANELKIQTESKKKKSFS